MMQSVWMRRVAYIVAMALIVLVVLDHYFDLFDSAPDPLRYRGGRGFAFKDVIWIECVWAEKALPFVILIAKPGKYRTGWWTGIGMVPLHKGWSRTLQYETDGLILEMKYDHKARQLTIDNKTMDTRNGAVFLCDMSAGFAAVRQVSWDFGQLDGATEEQQEQDLLRKLESLVEKDPVTRRFVKDGGLWTHSQQETSQGPEGNDKPDKVQMTATAIMQEFARGNYVERDAPMFGSGWEMTSENGETHHRSFLNHQAEQKLIPLGKKAVPELVEWLDCDNMHIRYIAAYSLERITGEAPYFPHFATLDQLTDNGWLKESREAWLSWYGKNKDK